MHLPTARLSATHSDLHRLRRSSDVGVVERGSPSGARTCALCLAERAARRVACPRHTAWRSTSGARCACHGGFSPSELPLDELLLGELMLSTLLLGKLLVGELLLGELLAWDRASASDCARARERASAPRV